MSQTSVNAVAAVRTAPVGLMVVTLNSGPGPPPFAGLGNVVVRMLDCSPSSCEATMRYRKCSRNRSLSARPRREFTAFCKRLGAQHKRYRAVLTEHARCMRATEPWRLARMRSGCGSLSLILDWSVEGPRGAKPRPSEYVDVAGDGGAESPPLPSPRRAISMRGRIVSVRSGAYPLGIRPAASLHVSRSPSCRPLPHVASGVAWCGMPARDATRGARVRDQKCGGSSGMARRLATEML